MKPCTMAGGQCPHEAVATVRLDHIGDRPLCAEHRDFVLRMGMGRELPTNAFVPAWKQRGLARDESGRLVMA